MREKDLIQPPSWSAQLDFRVGDLLTEAGYIVLASLLWSTIQRPLVPVAYIHTHLPVALVKPFVSLNSDRSISIYSIRPRQIGTRSHFIPRLLH